MTANYRSRGVQLFFFLRALDHCFCFLLYFIQSTQKALEEDLQIATTKIYQLTEAKETQMEEFNKAKAANSLVVTELKTTICNLKELLATEHQR